MACRYRWTELDSHIEVFGDAIFAGCISTRKSTVGRVALWSGQFVKAWSETVRIMWRVRTCSGCHVAIKSDAIAAAGTVHRLGSGKVRHLVVGDLWVQHHVRSVINSSLQECHCRRLRVMPKKSTLGQNHCCAIRKREIGYLFMDEPRNRLRDGDEM